LSQEVRSILDELNALCIEKDKENVLESRAVNVISSAINLIEYIQENYDGDTALELERRLVNENKRTVPVWTSRCSSGAI
jgi:hypothetical protein